MNVIKLAIITGALAIPTTAMAQDMVCGPAHVVTHTLETVYGESKRSQGVSANGALVEVFGSDSTGTWTITVTSGRGEMCLVASGDGFENFQQ